MNYYTKARLAPTVLAAPPILLMLNALVDVTANQWMDTNVLVMLFGKGTLAVAITYFMVMCNRTLGVMFQEKYNRGSLDLPTTRWLVATNTEISKAYRKCIGDKVRQDFQMELLPAEAGDTDEVRQHNVDIVGRIRQFVGSPAKLLRHNIEYGFARNLIGASVLALLAGLVNIGLNYFGMLPDWACRLSVAYVVLAAFLLLFSRVIMARYGGYYANVLFQTYLDKTAK